MKGFRSLSRIAVLVTFLLATLAAHAGDGKIHRQPKKVANRYIVMLYTDQPADAIGQELERRHGGKLAAVAKELGMFSIKLPNEAAAEAIARDARVAEVQEDGILEAQACNRTLDPSGIQWGLGHVQGLGSSLFANPNDVQFNDNPGVSVNSVRVYIIDGAIEPFSAYPVTDLTDPVYGNSKVKETHYFATGDGGGDDTGPHAVSPIFSHGTAVASILAGNKFGVVPEISSLISVVVLNGNNAASDTALMQASNFVVADHLAGVPAVANVSIGAKNGDDALDNMIKAIVNDGVFVAAAAGNWNMDACASSPGRITGPARSGMLLAGATNYDGYPAYEYTNVGPCVDIWASGGESYRPVTTSAGSGTGTSFAAPEIAGAAVLVLSSYPTWSPADVAGQIKYIWSTYNRGVRTLQVPYTGCFACTCDPPPATY